MIPTMTPQRFRAILDAYGAEPARWPEAERDLARRFAAEHAPARTWLQEARALDNWLAHDVVPPVSEARLYACVAGMVAANDVLPRAPKRRPVPVVWAAGLGLAACLAGAMFGVNMSMRSLADLRAEAVLDQAQLFDAENG